jgi:acyl carrier protein
VTAKADPSGEKHLVGYITPSNGVIESTQLRDELKVLLPAHMIPSHIIELSSFPLTPNGKIDLAALPFAAGACSPKRQCQKPADRFEEAIAEVWREVLFLPEISTDENFFEIGGDSLSATRMFARINRIFECDLSLREIIDHATVASLAKRLAARAGTSRLSPIRPRRERSSAGG